MEMVEGMSIYVLHVDDAAIISTSVSPLQLVSTLEIGIAVWSWSCDCTDGSEKTVAFGVKTLSKAKENYLKLKRKP